MFEAFGSKGCTGILRPVALDGYIMTYKKKKSNVGSIHSKREQIGRFFPSPR
jgi:hypothetical protein